MGLLLELEIGRDFVNTVLWKSQSDGGSSGQYHAHEIFFVEVIGCIDATDSDMSAHTHVAWDTFES